MYIILDTYCNSFSKSAFMPDGRTCLAAIVDLSSGDFMSTEINKS